MKTLNCCLAIICACLFSNTTFSQSFFKEGLVVNNYGDTIRGWIDYRQWEKNPTLIRFRTSESSSGTGYTINDLKYFEITGHDRYIHAVITKDMRPVELHLLDRNTSDSMVTDTVFLRELLRGELSLYLFVDFKPHFYTKKADGSYEELQYKLELSGDESRLSTKFIFRDQLKQKIDPSRSDEQVNNLLKRIRYLEKDLVRVTKMINELNGDIINYIVPKPKNRASWFAGAGIAYSNLSVSGTQNNLSNLDYAANIGPVIRAGVDLGILRNMQRLKARFELRWSTHSYEGNSKRGAADSTHFELKLKSITPSASILYDFIHLPEHRIYAGLSFLYNISSYPINRVVKRYGSSSTVRELDPYAMEKGWMSIELRAGYTIKTKFEIGATYRLAGSFSNYPLFAIRPTIITAGLNYHF